MSDHRDDLAVAFAATGPLVHVGTPAGLRGHLGDELWACAVWRADGTRLNPVDAPQGSPRLLATAQPAEPDAVLARLAEVLDTLRASAPQHHLAPERIPAAEGSLVDVLAALDEAVDLTSIPADPADHDNRHWVPGANWHNLAHALRLA